MAREREKLKRGFLELLEKDAEFRYAVASYLGLSEIPKRLEEHDKKFYELLTEIRALREGQRRLEEQLGASRGGFPDSKEPWQR